MKKVLVMAISLLLCIGLCACSADKNPLKSYVGNTYTGNSPWGDSIAITVDKCDAEIAELTYEENIDSDNKISCPISCKLADDNSMEITLTGELKNDDIDMDYRYDVRIEFKDDVIKLTFIDGQKNENSPEGGSGYNHAAALSDEEKTVTLKK